MKSLALFTLSFLLLFTVSVSAAATIERIEPPFWWVGMKDRELELVLYAGAGESGVESRKGTGPSIADAQVKLRSRLARLVSIHRPVNPHYLFITIRLNRRAAPGLVPIDLTLGDGTQLTVEYELKKRESHSFRGAGFGPRDAVYLIMPDRFANGDPNNDAFADMQESVVNRQDDFGRHGGDLAGIIANLPYIVELGMTRIWLNPVLENDMPEHSYHGYAATDMYKVDRRYGTNEQLQKLSREAALYGIGLIWDAVPNHIGREHWWLADLPEPDWLHPLETSGITSHRRQAVLDPYRVQEDLDVLTRGWFVEQMPDLGQGNPRMARYLVQNTIWWVEFAGLAGLRVDTYPYNDKAFMAYWVKAVLNEYPNLSMVGEEWSKDPAIVASWQQLGSPSMKDFPLNIALREALNTEEGWEQGIFKVYESLAADHHYPDPASLMVFADNHDMPRIHTALQDRVGRTRMAMAMMATIRGLPQILYGTELLMTHTGDNSHGALRMDFPGGWPGDEVNGFTGKRMNKQDHEFHQWFKWLFQWRMRSLAIAEGDFKHRAPRQGVYAYRRKADDDHILVVVNNNDAETSVPLTWLMPLLPKDAASREWQEIPAGKEHYLAEDIPMQPRSVLILDDVNKSQ